MVKAAQGQNAQGGLLALADVSSVLPDRVSGRPFWEQPWIASDLRAALFDGLNAGERVYFLADATLWRDAMDGQDVEAAGLPACCLTDLVTSEDLSRAGPHLLDLTVPPGADPTAAHRRICGPLQARGVGVFLRAVMPLGRLAAHLARLVLLPVEDSPKEERRYFRFWDPSVLATYLSGNGDDAQALGWLFRPDAASPPLQVLVPIAPDLVRHWRVVDPVQVPVPDVPPVLRARDIALFDGERQRKVCTGAMDWVCASYGEKDVPRATLVDAALRQVAPLASMGITSEYALRYVLAGFYLSGRSLRQLDKADHEMLSDVTMPQDKRAAAFLRTVQTRTGVMPLPGGGGDA